MGALFSISPWVWVGALVLLAATGGAGFLAGRDWEQGRNAIKERDVLVKRVEVIKLVAVGQEKISRAYEEGRASREAEFRELRKELEVALEGMGERRKLVCFTPPVVGVLNRGRAAGRLAPAASKPDAAVPASQPAGGRPS